MLASIVQPLDLGNVIVIVKFIAMTTLPQIMKIYSYFAQQFIFCNHTKYVKSELINMTQAWDKEKISVPDRN